MTENSVINNNSSDNTYLIFGLAGTAFGIRISHVIEVLQNFDITDVPNEIEIIHGIINFRGNILTICNVKRILELEEKEVESPILIVYEYMYDNQKEYVGLTTDKLIDVIEIKSRDIKTISEFGTICNPKYLTGSLKTETGYIFLLDIDLVFADIFQQCTV